MKKRLLSVLLVVAMVVSGFTGCAKNNTPKDVIPNPTKAAGETGTDDNADSETPASSLSGKIVYWSMWQETEPQAEILKNAIARFETANPNCKVTVEWKGRTISDLLLPALESGTQIDIFDTDPAKIYSADPGKLLDLGEFYASESAQGTLVKDSILEGLVNWDEALGAEVGLTGYHSVPYAPYVMSWFYNKEHFAKAGIEAVPTTFEELAVACEKLKAAGYTPITIDDVYMSLIYGYILQRAIGSENTYALSDSNSAEFKALWEDPKVLEVLTLIEDFAAKGYFSDYIDTNIYPAGQAEFALGNASMTVNGTWLPAEVGDIAGEEFQWGEFATPTLTGSSVPITENTIGGQAFMVSNATQNKDAVYKLLRAFISDETQKEFSEKGLVPCSNGAEWPANVAEQKDMVSKLTANVNYAAGVETDFGLSVMQTEITKVIGGDQSAAECLANIKSQIK
jgi:raffinose/stachyose/melibiose transport system substrate-binding protein